MNAVAVLLPESFRGGCSFGVGMGPISPATADAISLCYQGAAKFLDAVSTSGRKAFLGLFMQSETVFFVTDLNVA